MSSGKSGKFTCDCRGYREVSLCSHSVAVADMLGCLRQFLVWYAGSKKGPNLSQLGMPSNAGDKPGQKRRKRSRDPTSQKSTPSCKIPSTVQSRELLQSSCHHGQREREDMYRIKFLRGTQIRICYGCGNAIRIPPDVPAPPHDVVLARKEFRSYLNNEGILKLTAQKQDVHYHLMKACVTKRNQQFKKDDIFISPEIRKYLSNTHVTHFLQEFGLHS